MDPATVRKFGLSSPLHLWCAVHIIAWYPGNHTASMGRLLVLVETWDLKAYGVCVCYFTINRKFILFHCYQVLLKSALKILVEGSNSPSQMQDISPLKCECLQTDLIPSWALGKWLVELGCHPKEILVNNSFTKKCVLNLLWLSDH